MDVISMQREAEYRQLLLELVTEMKVTEDLGRKDRARWLEDKMPCKHVSLPSTQHTVYSYCCNLQLKSHYESILPLSSLLINHTKTLQNVLASIFPASGSKKSRKELMR